MNGMQWRTLAAGIPNWNVVYGTSGLWKGDGFWRGHDALRSNARQRVGRKTRPTAEVVNSLSISADDEAKNAAPIRGIIAGRNRILSPMHYAPQQRYLCIELIDKAKLERSVAW